MVRRNQIIAAVVVLVLAAGFMVTRGGDTPPDTASMTSDLSQSDGYDEFGESDQADNGDAAGTTDAVTGTDDAIAQVPEVPSAVPGADPLMPAGTVAPSLATPTGTDLASACAGAAPQMTVWADEVKVAIVQMATTDATDTDALRAAMITVLDRGGEMNETTQMLLEFVAVADPTTTDAVAAMREATLARRVVIAAAIIAPTFEEMAAILDASPTLAGLSDFPQLTAVLDTVPQCAQIATLITEF